MVAKNDFLYYVKLASRAYAHFAPLVGLFVVGASFIHVPSYLRLPSGYVIFPNPCLERSDSSPR